MQLLKWAFYAPEMDKRIARSGMLILSAASFVAAIGFLLANLL